jgi:hypothetical protein
MNDNWQDDFIEKYATIRPEEFDEFYDDDIDLDDLDDLDDDLELEDLEEVYDEDFGTAFDELDEEF